MKECIELHAQDIHHHYSDKNIDAVSNQKKAEKQNDSAHKIRCMKQKKC